MIEAHRALWGSPLAMVADHGSGNLSDEVKAYLSSYQIELLPAGPGNPKGELISQKGGRRSTSLSQSHRQPLLFDA